jgi:hypothetical protein
MTNSIMTLLVKSQQMRWVFNYPRPRHLLDILALNVLDDLAYL